MDDAELLRRFEDQSLPLDDMTHRAHIKLAYLYLRQYPFPEAQDRIRAGLKAYAAVHQVPNDGPTQGYNETTTQAFMHLVAAVMQAYDKAFPVTSAEDFCNTHPQLMTKYALRFFYSPQLRLDPLTKTEFLEPDLAPLPKRIKD